MIKSKKGATLHAMDFVAIVFITVVIFLIGTAFLVSATKRTNEFSIEHVKLAKKTQATLNTFELMLNEGGDLSSVDIESVFEESNERGKTGLLCPGYGLETRCESDSLDISDTCLKCSWDKSSGKCEVLNIC